MAKILNIFICIIVLCSCNNSSLQNAGLSKTSKQNTDSIIQNRIDAVEDIPVTTDTTFADTAKVFPVTAIIEKTEIKTVTPAKKDTVLSVVTTVIKNPSLPEIYASYIGQREATGKNDGPFVEKCLRTVGLPKGNPWCAAFVKYCLLQSRNELANKINGMALSCENKSHFIYRARQQIENSRPGDVFTIWFNNLNRIGHTGFVDKKVNENIFETVEGNTGEDGGRDGNGVFRRKRSKNSLYSISRWDK